jgi:ribonuclease HI
MERINAFHVGCLRKILRIPNTYVTKIILNTRTYTNAEVYKIAGEYPLMYDLENVKIKHFAHLYRRPLTDPLRKVTFAPSKTILKEAVWRGKTTQGRPPNSWTKEVMKYVKETFDLYNPIEKSMPQAKVQFLLADHGKEVEKALEFRKNILKNWFAGGPSPQEVVEQTLLAWSNAKLKRDYDIEAWHHTFGTHHLDPFLPPPGNTQWWPQPTPTPPPIFKLQPLPFSTDHVYYTDGSCKLPPNEKANEHTPAGWGLVYIDARNVPSVKFEMAGKVFTDKELHAWYGANKGSNNTGEMTAVLQVLRHVLFNKLQGKIEIRTDSSYVIKTLENIWNTVENPILFKVTRGLLIKLRQTNDIFLSHVRAHKGEFWNERADMLANAGAIFYIH